MASKKGIGPSSTHRRLQSTVRLALKQLKEAWATYKNFFLAPIVVIVVLTLLLLLLSTGPQEGAFIYQIR